jgi:hypothetical protein
MRDLAMLRRAAAEFFLEGFFAKEAERVLANTPPELQEEARKSILPARTAPDGAFEWIEYLFWLERVLEIVDLPLTGVEVEGLLVLKRERNRFQAEHPPCPHCGMPNEPHSLRCRECMEEIN